MIEENFSFIYSDPATLKHSNKNNPVSFEWKGNYFNSINGLSGNLLNGAHINLVSLEKKEGWRDLEAGTVDKSFFSIIEN